MDEFYQYNMQVRKRKKRVHFYKVRNNEHVYPTHTQAYTYHFLKYIEIQRKSIKRIMNTSFLNFLVQVGKKGQSNGLEDLQVYM